MLEVTIDALMLLCPCVVENVVVLVSVHRSCMVIRLTTVQPYELHCGVGAS